MGDTTGIQTNIAENVQEDEREMARQSGGEAQRMRLTASHAAHEGLRRAPGSSSSPASRSLARSWPTASSRQQPKEREDQTERHPDSFTVTMASHARTLFDKRGKWRWSRLKLLNLSLAPQLMRLFALTCSGDRRLLRDRTQPVQEGDQPPAVCGPEGHAVDGRKRPH